MELQTIEMARPDARRAFADYRKAVHERHDEEDAQIMRAYRELAKGTPLIRLSEVMRLGGLTSLGGLRDWRGAQTATVPRLAVARADVRFVWTPGVRGNGGCEFRYTNGSVSFNSRQRIRLAAGTFDADDSRWTGNDWSLTIRAMAPNIPPALRPAHHLRNYHLLWEAEWQTDRSVPPGDPAPLKHIGGDLYAVLATWDLTPVEQAVLAGRAPDA